MNKQYSDAEQYSKHDRDSHDADNARILFLDYGFTAEQIKRFSETGYIFDWEGDARTDVRYCINHDLLPHSEQQKRVMHWAVGAAELERIRQPMISTKFETSYKPNLTADQIESISKCSTTIREFGLIEDRDLIHTAIVKFVRFYVTVGWLDHELEQALGELRTRLYTANCVNIENTVIRVMEDLK